MFALSTCLQSEIKGKRSMKEDFKGSGSGKRRKAALRGEERRRKDEDGRENRASLFSQAALNEFRSNFYIANQKRKDLSKSWGFS